MSQSIDPNHQQTRGVLRIVGPLILLAGLGFMVVGVGNFFMAFGSGSMPRYFWCAFVGMPLVFVGIVTTSIAFMGRVQRYVAGESLPVTKDSINYMADGTKGAVKTMATALGEGLRAGMDGRTDSSEQTCSACGAANDDTAKFCKSCGKPLAKACASCGEANDADAKFCDNCGGPLG